MNTLNNEEIAEILKQKSVYLKYVRLQNDKVYFAVSEMYAPDHKNMIEEGDEVKSAAYLRIRYRNNVRELEVSERSQTLSIGSAHDDESFLANYLKQSFGYQINQCE